MSEQKTGFFTTGQSLSDVVKGKNEDMDGKEIEFFVPDIKIRQKQKGENMRALGSRVPVWMIEELKMLADHLESNVEDMIAGILESVLEKSMDGVYKKAEANARKMRNSRKS